MKPVVSSLVALAIAIAPISAFAKPAHKKTAHAKVVQHPGDKTEKADAGDKGEAAEASDAAAKAAPSPKPKSPMVHVKFDHKKHGAGAKPALHHAHNVDLGGAGHKEPKVDGNGAIVPASLTTKIAPSHGKTAHAAKPAAKTSDLPKLPNPNAGKPSKGGAEKGAKKPAEKKHEAAGDSTNDGEPTRDEELADLVARIRGLKGATSGAEESASPVEPPAPDAKSAKTAPSEPHKLTRTSTREPACTKDPVEIVRGPEIDRFELTRCDGSIAPFAVEHLSIAVRPGGAARPTAALAELAKKPGPEIAAGIHRVDPRLIGRLQALADHFAKPGTPARVFVISGYRPMSVGSMHSTGRAIDLRLDGIKNEDVVAFCKTMGDTGCGYYPNSSFVHLDVRDPGAGHVTWIDASGPGETPRYVQSWPPPPVATRALERASNTAQLAEEGALLLRAQRPLDRDSVAEPVDEHPAEVAP